MLKKIVSVLLCVMMLCGMMLCGCSTDDVLDKLPEKNYEHGSVSIKLPNSFKDYSNQDMAEGKDFMFANSEIGIVGVKESKKDIKEMFEITDLEGYANLIAELYELDTAAKKENGHWSFTYEQEIDGKDWTYLCVFQETSTDYWNIQAYCETSDFEENEDKLWDYATRVKIADSGEAEEDPTEPDPTETDPTEPDSTDPEPTEEDPTEAEKSPVTIDVPDDFLNYSNTAIAGDYAFMYVNDAIGLLGVQENKEELFLYFDEMDLEGYANLIAELYALDTAAEQKDGVWTISYSDDSIGYTYVCAFYETEADFWNIQGYCETDSYEEYADDIWQYITSVEFAEN